MCVLGIMKHLLRVTTAVRQSSQERAFNQAKRPANEFQRHTEPNQVFPTFAIHA